VELNASEEDADLGTNANTLFDFCSTDSWEFLSKISKHRPCLIQTLAKFFIIPSMMSTEGTKMLLILTAVSAVHSLLLVPAIVGKVSPSSCNGKSLCNRPNHTNSKPSCSPAAVLEIWQLLACLHKAVIGISCSLFSLEEASLCQDS
jgi:hypothetical protein